MPTKLNPLGAKGAGEAGTVGALAAAMNAIVDAIGTEHIEMPTTPERVWQALRGKNAWIRPVVLVCGPVIQSPGRRA